MGSTGQHRLTQIINWEGQSRRGCGRPGIHAEGTEEAANQETILTVVYTFFQRYFYVEFSTVW
jgi:hypothetical protein